ncbi:30S ribosomal protein S15 [bacterium]|nr:30S ribosomal protein S15 [bacterium]
MIRPEEKQKLIKAFGKSPNDVGSCEVQIALLSERIKQISNHLKAAPKDFASTRGLMMLIGKRRSFLNYLKKNNEASYNNVVQSLKTHGLV